MARIRVIKFKKPSKKEQPKVAYFHTNNFNNAVSYMKPVRTVGTKNNIVVLNNNQFSKYVTTLGNKINNRIFLFHRGD